MPSTKSQIRRQIRKRRKLLSPEQQQSAAEQLAVRLLHKIQQILQQKVKRKAQQNQPTRIALFISMDGEIGTQVAIEQLWLAQIEVYIPVIHPFNSQQLLFIRYQPDTSLVRSHLGMLEPLPDCTKVCPLAQLDILFTPLVAFDAQGNRLGMGGGFYDRTLEFHYQSQRTTPQVIGIAHDCQKVDLLPIEPWDISLSEIITPTSVFQR